MVQLALFLAMICKHCLNETLIRKGKIGIKQRFQCTSCKKYQQDLYAYTIYDPKDDKNVKRLNAEGVGIRSMSRILGYSRGTIIRRMKYLAGKVIKPKYLENNQ